MKRPCQLDSLVSMLMRLRQRLKQQTPALDDCIAEGLVLETESRASSGASRQWQVTVGCLY